MEQKTKIKELHEKVIKLVQDKSRNLQIIQELTKESVKGLSNTMTVLSKKYNAKNAKIMQRKK